MNITELIEAAKIQDDIAIATLMKRVSMKGKFIAPEYLKNEDAAEEALQMSFIWAFSNLDRLKKSEKFDRWFYKILIQQCSNLYNKQKNNPVTFSTLDAEGVNIEEIIPSQYLSFDPKGNFDYNQLLESVRQILNEHPDAKRQALYAYFNQKLRLQQTKGVNTQTIGIHTL